MRRACAPGTHGNGKLMRASRKYDFSKLARHEPETRLNKLFLKFSYSPPAVRMSRMEVLCCWNCCSVSSAPPAAGTTVLLVGTRRSASASSSRWCLKSRQHHHYQSWWGEENPFVDSTFLLLPKEKKMPGRKV